MDSDAKKTITILVTGANSGLGFSICCRLVDEFLHTRPQNETLHLLFTTRSPRKSDDTLRRLNAHFQRTLRTADKRMPNASLLLEPRIKLEGLLVDLTRLLTVKKLAEQLLARGQSIDGVVWNAGSAGWSHLNWGKAVWGVLTGIVQATTYPEFMVTKVGALAPRQLGDGYGSVHTFEEPRLGEVWTANVFGHYMLTHWLGPVLGEGGRVVWTGSIGGSERNFDEGDVQCIGAEMAYEGTKRLTDLLVLTSELPSTKPHLSTFLPTTHQRPKMYLTHPGVVATSISGLNPFISLFMLAALYIARLLGSPWHPISSYKGAVSAVYCLLSPANQLPDREDREGKGKWGSACGVYGEEWVARTEVEGWGFTGRVDDTEEKVEGAVKTKRPGYKGAVTREWREEFEGQGSRVWAEMERLRQDWEGRMGPLNLRKEGGTEEGT